MNFKNQIKTLKVYEEFKGYISNNKLGQAYLFLSPDKISNQLIVNEIAKLILCDSLNGCDVCKHCLKINAGTHPDLLIYPKEKNFAVVDAGEIYDNIQVKPMLADYKVFIINNIDLATEQAQNKMLKIVEEPPKNVIFLFTACNAEKVLQTIKSRTISLRVGKLKREVLSSSLKENNNNLLDIALDFGDGYIGKVLNVLQDDSFVEKYKNMINLVKNFKKSEQIPFFSVFFTKNRQIFEDCLYLLNDFFRDMLMIKINQKDLVKNKSLISEFELLLADYSVLALNEILKNLNLVKKKLDSNVSLLMLADNFLFDILEVKYLCK